MINRGFLFHYTTVVHDCRREEFPGDLKDAWFGASALINKHRGIQVSPKGNIESGSNDSSSGESAIKRTRPAEKEKRKLELLFPFIVVTIPLAVIASPLYFNII